MGLLSRLFGGGNDGSLPGKAVIVNSVAEEYAWVQQHCPGYQFQMQSLQEIEGKPYDVLKLENARGEERCVHFDISRFYGKE
jgi:hypothetical protein